MRIRLSCGAPAADGTANTAEGPSEKTAFLSLAAIGNFYRLIADRLLRTGGTRALKAEDASQRQLPLCTARQLRDRSVVCAMDITRRGFYARPPEGTLVEPEK